MHAGTDDYDGVPYADLAFTEVDWSEAVGHVRNRSGRKDRPGEFDVEPEWADEALADPHRLVGSADSKSGLTVKVIGLSSSAPARKREGTGRVLKVIVAPKDHPPTGRWWGGDRDGRQRRRQTPVRGGTMSSSIRDTLAAEAAEAEARRDEPPGRMHRARARGPVSHVYTVRMPVDRLAELRDVAADHGEQPSALMRRWVLERLDAERGRHPTLTDVRRSLHAALDDLDHIEPSRS
ncbi:MAG: hypothetical protein ACRDQA_31435 [Nocardioidaceae bacterium]